MPFLRSEREQNEVETLTLPPHLGLLDLLGHCTARYPTEEQLPEFPLATVLPDDSVFSESASL
jgi:hypothetical protein